MFDHDVTKNYQLQDATFEILIMLAGAFLLGTLFCWALGKLRKNKRKHPYQRKTVDHQNGYRQPIQQAGAIHPDKVETNSLKGIAGGAAGIIDNPAITATNSKAEKTAFHIADEVANTTPPIKENLADNNSSVAEQITDTASPAKSNATNTETTIQETVSNTLESANANNTAAKTGEESRNKAADVFQATTPPILNTEKPNKEKVFKAMGGTKNEIEDAKITTSESVANPTSEPITASIPDPLEVTDNFKKIEGIGPKIETALHTAGIKTYADLRASDTETLKAILAAASPSFKMHDPETWPYQADLAYNKNWEKLKEYQDFLMGREE